MCIYCDIDDILSRGSRLAANPRGQLNEMLRTIEDNHPQYGELEMINNLHQRVDRLRSLDSPNEDGVPYTDLPLNEERTLRGEHPQSTILKLKPKLERLTNIEWAKYTSG